jgi:hypothetical protein
VGQASSVAAVPMREVAIMSTEDAGLPDHERDETRRQEGTSVDDDAAEVANLTDSGLGSEGLPAHEDDARLDEDTATGEQNP